MDGDLWRLLIAAVLYSDAPFAAYRERVMVNWEREDTFRFKHVKAVLERKRTGGD